MKRLIRLMLLPVTLLLTLSKGMLTLLMVGSLLLSLASVTVSGVFGALSSVVEAVAGPRTVRAEHRAKLNGLEKENAGLARRSAALADDNKRLARDLDETRKAYGKRVSALRDENRRLSHQLADRHVTYRGARRLPGEAVRDTTGRLVNRATVASGRNVASVFAEALPVVGIGVIVAATALEINDSCEMMKDLHELDLAFNPDNAIDGTELCGLRVPERAEVWQKVRESPASAWNGARSYMPELPDFSETYASVAAEATSFMCWVFPCDTEEVIPE